MFKDQSQAWLAKAESLKPQLFRQTVKAVNCGRAVRDDKAFQGWKFVSEMPASELYGHWQGRDMEAGIDFGQYCVGCLTIHWSFDTIPDAPFRIKFVFAEFPAELGEEFGNASGGPLARSHLQDEVVVLDDPGKCLRLPRRYAFRYLKIVVENNSIGYKFRIDSLEVETVSSADPARLRPTGFGLDREIDRVGLNTLAGCMQDVFEDGPKRDRRLWNGDLRLQALVDSVTTRNFDLVKRCIYLLAGLVRENGVIGSDVYVKPYPARGTSMVYDYTALFPLIISEYAESSGDWETACELWPLTRRQVDFVCEEFDENGVFMNTPKYWRLIDWCDELDRTTPEQGAVIWGLRTAAQIAGRIGYSAEAVELNARADFYAAAALEFMFDRELKCFVSGPERQISWASQSYMVLAGVVSGREGTAALKAAMDHPQAIKPGSPYLMSYVVESLIKCGAYADARRLIHSYWGKMVELGADTFWEVFDPNDQYKSPYGNHLLNSACHAWSCTPSYFYRIMPPESSPRVKPKILQAQEIC